MANAVARRLEDGRKDHGVKIRSDNQGSKQ
jgi:hypothetical protein